MSGGLDGLWYNLNFCWVWATFTFGFSFRCVGSRNMPKSGPVLVLANHESYFDPLAVGLAVRRRLYYLARKTLFKEGVFGKYLRSVGCVPVDQVGVAKEGLRASVELLQAGKPLLVFPEGERTWTGQMQGFKAGITLVLRRVQPTIVPVGVAGAFELYPRTAKIPRLAPCLLGPGISASVGKPISPSEYARMDREPLLDFLFQRVQAEVNNAEKIGRPRSLPE